METPLPPVPDDLWPTIPPTKSQRALHRAFSVEISGPSAKPLLNSLSRSIHLEMEGAGQWAAKAGADVATKDLPSSQTLSRQCAHDASRLLSIYTAVYNAADSPGQDVLVPDDLKASATRSYQKGFLNEQKELLRQGVPFNDGLYSQLRGKPLGGGPKFQR